MGERRVVAGSKWVAGGGRVVAGGEWVAGAEGRRVLAGRE